MKIKFILNNPACLITFVIAATFGLTYKLLYIMQPKPVVNQVIQKFITADPELGWRNITGIYDSPAIRVLGDGRRATNDMINHFNEAEANLIMLGCSYTYGAGLSDPETFSWKLQELHPKFKLSNYGVNGYGTYQALLKLQQILPKVKDPKIVVYNYIDHHELRNIARAEWLTNIPDPIPYVGLDADYNLVYTRTKDLTKLEFLRQLEVVRKIERKLYTLDLSRAKTKRKMLYISEKLISQMRDLSNAYGAQFYFVILEARPEIRSHYLQTMSLSVVDCTHPNSLAMRVPGDGHPNAILNTYWANCISNNIKLS